LRLWNAGVHARANLICYRIELLNIAPAGVAQLDAAAWGWLRHIHIAVEQRAGHLRPWQSVMLQGVAAPTIAMQCAAIVVMKGCLQ
jgi:hypothetical protein